MNIFEKIGNFFASLFNGSKNDIIHQVLVDIETPIQKALPVVGEVSTELGDVAALTQDQLLEKASGILNKMEVGAEKIAEFLAANAAAPIPSFIHNLVVVALQFAPGVGIVATALKDLDLAVQFAFNIWSKEHPAVSGTATVAAVLTPASKAVIDVKPVA